MKNIQFLTDYSWHSRQVYHYALHMAHHFGATVTVTHVFAPHFPTALDEFSETPGHDAGDQLEKYLDTQWDKERERMDYFIQEHTPKAFKDVPLKKEIGYGHPVEEICRMHEAFPYDLVVMGMNSRDSIMNNLLGSTALGMIDEANIPVLLIPPTAQFLGIRRILFPTNLHPEELKIIDYLLQWARAFHSKLFCFHLHPTDPQMVDEFNKYYSPAKIQFQGAFDRDELEFVVIEGKQKQLVESIEKETGLLDADLLVMQTHHRNLFSHLFEESTTKTVASDVYIPVLVLKEAWFEKRANSSIAKAKIL